MSRHLRPVTLPLSPTGSRAINPIVERKHPANVGLWTA